MKIHEYQAKELFRSYDVEVPAGSVAFSIDEALAIAGDLGSWPVVVKAQIHAGGRGKGGGVRLADSADMVREAATAILGKHLVTPQTGPEGRKVSRILIEQGLEIKDELYLSILPGRSSAKILVVASRSGGMNIEEVAASSPDKIITVSVNPLAGIQPFHCRRVAFDLELPSGLQRDFSALLNRLYKLFVEKDCSLLEINPLVITTDARLVALDAKVEIDPNALLRQQDLLAFRDEEEEDPLEVAATRAGLNYINLNGDIGNMVNGAGLAMATMDIIKAAGAEPANFLDVGGGASAKMVEKGFRIILSDSKVKGILINIFGGILRCDVLAEGVVQAARKTNIQVPVVIRMEGTNVDEGRRILAESGLNLIAAVNLADAAGKIASII